MISRKIGEEIKLSTFLKTFNTPNISTSIRIDLYNVRINPYIPNPVRYFKCQKFGHGQGQCKGTTMFQMFRGGPWLLQLWTCPQMYQFCRNPNGLFKTVHFTYKKKNQAIKIERNVSYPEARTLVSMANDSCAQTPCTNCITSVKTQADIT